MFDKDFYPTPKEVIFKMLRGLDIANKIVLEPSAGKGDIINILKREKATVLACEKNEELAKICTEKADVFLGYDFLEVTSDQISHIDFIVMNPPFSEDDKHILHAWEICPEGCEIVSLCNWETLNNPYTKSRKQLIEIIENSGKIENLGECFSTAERKTNVEVGLIRLTKPKGDDYDEFKDYFDLGEEYQDQQDGIMSYDVILEIVNRYVGAVKMFDEVEEISNKINSLTSSFSRCPISFGAHYDSRGDIYRKVTRDVYKKELQKAAWDKVFSMMDMEKYMTHKVKEKINKFVEQQYHVPFTRKNIYLMIQLIAGTHEDRMKSIIVEMFDWLTSHHHENRFQQEGWKTNSEYMVNKKFIAPYQRLELGWHGEPKIAWSSNGHQIDDLVKAICYITGEDYDRVDATLNENDEEIKTRHFIKIEELYRTKEVGNKKAVEVVKELNKAIPELSLSNCKYLHEYCASLPERDGNLMDVGYRIGLDKETIDKIKAFYAEKNLPSSCFGKCYEYKEFGKWYDFNFFEVKVYKKGTLHARFKDEKVWELFNKVACEAKGFQLASKYTSDYKTKGTEVEIYN